MLFSQRDIFFNFVAERFTKRKDTHGAFSRAGLGPVGFCLRLGTGTPGPIRQSDKPSLAALWHSSETAQVH